MTQIGIVAIGRNEGDRLQQCLTSVAGRGHTVIYVDSGSSDGSVALAQAFGATVAELDTTQPFTAARARNLGFTTLLQIAPDVEFVQFVDGDCEVVPGWLDQASQALQQDITLTVVCGRRRERFPERSLYNYLCDLEWDTPVGEAFYCGGDAMMRVAALRQAHGFNPDLIAGEEPELCVRLRQQGGRILRINTDMTRHDANMTQISQWWKRMLRAGYAYGEGAALHGRAPMYHWSREVRSIWIWGLVMPLLSLALAWPTHGLSLGLLLLYPWMVWNIARYFQQQRDFAATAAWTYGIACMVAKFPQLQGLLRFQVNRLLKRRSTLIEYSTATS